MHPCYRSRFFMLFMECIEFSDIDIGNPIAVCQHKIIRVDIFLHFQQAASGHRFGSRVSQGDFKIIKTISFMYAS